MTLWMGCSWISECRRRRSMRGSGASVFALMHRSTCAWIRRRARRRLSFWRVAGIREITEVIRNYGEERFAFQIAKKIVAARSERPVATTGELAALVREAVRTREPGQDPATRTFQALRIHVNQELEQLALVLPQAMDVLKPGGRLVVISFHSLEDRIVKRFMRDAVDAITCRRIFPYAASILPQAQAASGRQAGQGRSRPKLRQSAGAQRGDARGRESEVAEHGSLQHAPCCLSRCLLAQRGDLAAQGTQALSGAGERAGARQAAGSRIRPVAT